MIVNVLNQFSKIKIKHVIWCFMTTYVPISSCQNPEIVNIVSKNGMDPDKIIGAPKIWDPLFEYYKNPEQFIKEVLENSEAILGVHNGLLIIEGIVLSIILVDIIQTINLLCEATNLLKENEKFLKTSLSKIIALYDIGYNWESIGEVERNNAKSELSNIMIEIIFPISNALSEEKGRLEQRESDKKKWIWLTGITLVASLFSFNGFKAFDNSRQATTALFSGSLAIVFVGELTQLNLLKSKCDRLKNSIKLFFDLTKLCFKHDESKTISENIAKANTPNGIDLEYYAKLSS